MRPLHLPLLLALMLSACTDDPSLTIRLRTPASIKDLASVQGKMQLELLDGNTGLPVYAAAPTPASLSARQRLFSQLDLVEQRLYRVKVKIALDKADKVTCTSAREVVGQSPVFRYNHDLEQISVYVDCADTFSQVESLKRERLYHTATFLPEPRPYGQVVVVGGAKLNLSDLEGGLKKENVLSSIEIFDPDRGTFQLQSKGLSKHRFYHQATAVNDSTVLVTGGASINDNQSAIPEMLVERLRNGEVTGLHSMQIRRYLHSAVLLSPTRLLLAGGVTEKGWAKLAELYDPKAEVQKKNKSGDFHRGAPTVVAYDSGDQALIFGGRIKDSWGMFEEIFCDAEKCPCVGRPCFDMIMGKPSRSAATGTLVTCGAGGSSAIYLVGGSYNDPLDKYDTTTYFDDILCFDPATSKFHDVGRLLSARTGHTATLLPGPKDTHRLLVAGGSTTGSKVLKTAALFPVSCNCKTKIQPGQIRQITMTSDRRVGHQATLLADGTVLLTGGALTNTAERFNPDI